MSHYFCTLDFGKPIDAKSWEKGCLSKGMRPGSAVLGMENGMQPLTTFFASAPDWLYMSGHYQDGVLWAQVDPKSPRLDTVLFQRDRVHVWSGGSSAALVKGEGFQMHRNVAVIVWGGCRACEDPAQLRILRELFDNPTILGYTGRTGWQISNAMLGGGFIREHFFANLCSHYPAAHVDSEAFVDAWMQAAKAGYAGTPMESLFRAVDCYGQMWDLQRGEIVKGARV